MGLYKEGLNRKQQLMFPPSLDELVSEDNTVRAIEEYVNILNISKLKIKTKKSLIKDGQPAFHPKLLLKISKEEIEKLKKKQEQLNKDLELLNTLGKEQYNKTDKDATAMSKLSHNLMAYNSQISVDHKYKFIVATDISTNGHDLDQLHNMAIKTKEIVNNPNMIVTADKGYYSTKEIKKCTEENIETIIPPRCTGANKKMATQKSKNIVRKRGSIVEHPFGTIKRTLGWNHFLVRGKKKVLGENALIMFTYNFKRLLNLIGIALFKKLCLAIKNNNLTQIRQEIEVYI